jgi:hypothetical protein
MIPNVVFDRKVLLAGAAACSAGAGHPVASRGGADRSERGYTARHPPGDITPGIGEQQNSCSSNISADARKCISTLACAEHIYIQLLVVPLCALAFKVDSRFESQPIATEMFFAEQRQCGKA